MPKGNYSVPHQIKASNVSGTNIFERRFTGIYRHLLSKCTKNAVLERLKMVQCKCFYWNQPKTFFRLCCGSIFFILSELRFVKRMRFFERNCIVKWVIFFAGYCWLWNFQLENLKYFLLEKLQISGFKSFAFWSKFRFLGLFYGILTSAILKFYVVGKPWWSTFLLSLRPCRLRCFMVHSAKYFRKPLS